MKTTSKFLMLPAAAALLAWATLPAAAQMGQQNTPGHTMGGMMHGGMMHGGMMHHPMMRGGMMSGKMKKGKMMHHPMMKGKMMHKGMMKGMPGTAVGGGTGMRHSTPGAPP